MLHCGGATNSTTLRQALSWVKFLEEKMIVIPLRSTLIRLRREIEEINGYRVCAASRMWFALKSSTSEQLKALANAPLSEFVGGSLAETLVSKVAESQQVHEAIVAIFMRMVDAQDFAVVGFLLESGLDVDEFVNQENLVCSCVCACVRLLALSSVNPCFKHQHALLTNYTDTAHDCL